MIIDRRIQAMLFMLGGLFFFLMLSVPTSYRPVKAVMLAIILGAIVLSLVRTRSLRLHPSIILWTAAMTSVGLGFVLLGLVKAAPGAVAVSSVYVFWPAVYALLVTTLVEPKARQQMNHVLVASGGFIGFYSIYYIAYALGIVPASLYIELDLGQKVGFYAGFVEFNLYCLSTLFFIVPYLITRVIVAPASIVSRRETILVIGVAALAILATLMSGRKVLWFVVFLTPFIIALLSSFTSLHWRRQVYKRLGVGTVFAVVALILLVAVLGRLVDLEFSSLYKYFLSAFDFENNQSGSLRKEQFVDMIKDLSESPVFGDGLGAVTSGIVRSTKAAWAYELSYAALLFQTGVVGFLIYSAAVVWVVWHALKVVARRDENAYQLLAIIVGTLTFLIGNASNPYLAKFEFLWIIFLPLAYVNASLLESRSGESSTLEPGLT